MPLQVLLEGMERFNRLSTDLANERTLLAWIRTSLAAIRTLFTYLGLSAISDYWRHTITATEVAMATLVVSTATCAAQEALTARASGCASQHACLVVSVTLAVAAIAL